MTDKPIPEKWRGVYGDLKTYFHECRSDEVGCDWPTVSYAQAIEELGGQRWLLSPRRIRSRERKES